VTDEELNRRFDHHPPANRDVAYRHELVRETCKAVAASFDLKLPESREKALALTKVEEAMFWANAAIAREGAL
jgi:hypothetical protein